MENSGYTFGVGDDLIIFDIKYMEVFFMEVHPKGSIFMGVAVFYLWILTTFIKIVKSVMLKLFILDFD
jgi:hypothetical protein